MSAPWPAGAPATDFTRSPAAERVGRLAAASGLFLFHFEHRVRLDQELTWEAGVLPEPKYQAFRHDLPLGSFHPGHRAKWSTHELCHGLVGFAWRPDPSPLFLATAGRLAELLPVVLWYFLDEIGLRRCVIHQGGDALFQTLCPDCEAIAGPHVEDAEAERRLADARRFLDRELAAIARTVRLGRPVPHQWATLNLCSDGLAYAHSHGDRLRSPTFARFADRFLVEGGGWSPTLEALEARVLAVFDGLIGTSEPPPLAPSAALGRARWIAQDLGWRLLSVWEQTEGEAADVLLQLVDAVDRQPVSDTIATYRELEEEWVLPAAEEVFAVGYDLEGTALGRSGAQILAGLTSAVPQTLDLLEGFEPSAFLQADAPQRRPLAHRFAQWLAHTSPGPAADMAAFEAAVLTARSDPDAPRLGSGSGVRLARGVELLSLGIDPIALSEGNPSGPTGLILHRTQDGDLLLLDVDPKAIDQLRSDPGAVEPELRAALTDLGILVPDRWSL